MLALSVSISTSSSPLDTESPSDLSHLRIVPSSMESDRRGIATSAMGRRIAVLGRNRRHGGVGAGTVAGGREREPENGASTRAVLHPDPPPVALDDLAADRQADAGALVGLAVVQALEHLEHALAVLGLDPDARVL